jgi:hypothetical protein
MEIAMYFSYHQRSHTYRDTIFRSCHDQHIVSRFTLVRVPKILHVTITKDRVTI